MKTKALALTLGALLASASVALATPNNASMSFGVSTSLVGNPAVNDSSTDAWAAVPGPLSVSASATSSDDNGNTGNAFGLGNAAWAADGNSGSIFMKYGWSGTGHSFNTNNGNPDWSYTFTADANGAFVLNYDIVGSGNTFGLWGFSLGHDLDNGVDAPVTNAFSPDSSGTFMGDITAGQTYTVSLSNNGNIFYGDESNPSNGSSPGSVTGNFDWTIRESASVPDSSSTVALLGLAFAGLGWMRRKL